jgi:hypothetical protein
MTLNYNYSIGRIQAQKCYERYAYFLRKMNVNGESLIFGIALGQNQTVSQ